MEKNNKADYFSYLEVFLFTLLITCNLLTHEKVSGLLIAIPEFTFVFVLLLLKKTEKAFIYHLIFSITCFAIPFSQIENPGQTEFGLFNYSKLKLIGPLGFYHLFLFGFIFFKIKYKINFRGDNLLKLLYKFLLYITVFGVFFGFIGVIFFEYYLVHFISYSVYAITTLAHLVLILKFNSKDFLDKIFKIVIGVLIAAPIATLITFLLGYSSSYGSRDISIINEAGYFSVILIFCIFKFKKFWLPLFSVLNYFYFLGDGGMGGKGIVITLIVCLLFFMKSLMKKKANFKIRYVFIRYIIYPLVIVSILNYLASYTKDYNLFAYKFDSVLSLVYIFDGTSFFHLIPESPRIRIISLVNILYEQIQNPINLFLGSGFGSFFYDNFNFFGNMEMTNAFRDIEISTRKYGRPHDTIAAVPLANGLLGLYFIFKLTFKYLRRGLKYNFLAFGAIPWLGLAFYYNPQFALVGLLMVFTSFKKI